MRFRPLLAVAALALGVAVAPADAATTPDPRSCTVTAEGSHAPDVANLVPTGSLVVASAQIVCLRDPLTTPPADYLVPWRGSVTMHIYVNGGSFVCGHGPDYFDTVGPALVMTISEVCTLPFTDARRNAPMHINLAWATFHPYNCCGVLLTPITPVGAGVY